MNTPRLRQWLARGWPLLVLAGGTAAIVVWAHHAVFPAYSWNRDEPVYVWHADLLQSGRLASPDGGTPAAFHPWLSGARDGELFSQYTIGWPLVLAAARLATGSTTTALAAGAMLAVVGTVLFARELTRDRTLAIVAGALMMLSPIVPIQGGVHLGYLFTLGLGLLFATALLSGVRHGSAGRVLVAGGLLGWIFLTRPFDALLWGGAVGAYVVWSVWRGHRVARLRTARAVLAGAAGAAPLVALTLWCNRRLTGRFTEFPITVADPLDTFGFGVRRIMPGHDPVDYGLAFAVKGTLKNGGFLPLFLAGAYVGLAVALVGLWRRRRDPATVALVALLAAFPVGYFAFFGTTISSYTSRISGPIYFVPLYAPLCILIAGVVVDVFRRRRPAGLALAAVIVVSGVPFAIDRVAVNRAISEAQRPWKAAAHEARALPGPALVFVAESDRYLLFTDPYAANEPDLGGGVLYATDRLGHNLELIARHPDRVAYREEASLHADDLGPREEPRTPRVRFTPLSVVDATALTVRADIENTTEAPAVVAVLEAGGHRETVVVATDARRGDTYTIEWTVTAGDLRDATGTIIVRVGFAATPDAVRARARQVVAYRLAGESVQALVPARAARYVDINGNDRWRPAFELPELTMTVHA